MTRHSTGIYTADWPEIARDVKEKAGWKCVRCGHVHELFSGHVLTVHHLDMNPQNNVWWNTPALCQRCHLRIQGKVILERGWMFEHSEWFKPYVAGYYASIHGFRTDKEFVLEHLEELLELGKPKVTK